MTHVDLHFSAIKKVESVKYKILSLAQSFDNTGNEKLADQLYSLAEDIEDGKKDFEKSYELLFNGWTRSVNEGTANMINVALAITKVPHD